MTGDSKGWPKGEPVGITIDVDEISEEDGLTIAAYQALGVPRQGPMPSELMLATLTREEARDVLLGKTLGKSVPVTNIPDVVLGFDPDSGTDDDALYYAAIAPDYKDHNLNADGEAKTRGQRQEEADYALLDNLHAQQEEETIREDDPIPPYEPTQPGNENTFTISTLQTSLEESANAEPAQSLTPASASMSIPSSKAVSATSSQLDVHSSRAGRSTVAARRSRNYQGPYTQPVSSSRPRLPRIHRSPSRTRHYSPPPSRHASPPRHGSSRRYSPQNRDYNRCSLSPDRRPMRRRSPTPPYAVSDTIRGRNRQVVPEVRIIQTQEVQRIVQDTDTGMSALVPIMQVSSSQMGLDLSALTRPANPESRRERLGAAHYSRSIEGSREYANTYYRPRSRSPPRESSSRRRSPPPVSSRRVSPPHRRSPPPIVPHRRSPPPRRRSPPPPRQPRLPPRRSSPSRHDPPRQPDSWPTIGHAREEEAMELDTWGESPLDPSSSQPPVSLGLSTHRKTSAGPSGTS